MAVLNLSYETIFDILMREKTRDELQKLDDHFFSDVVAYVQSKAVIESADEDDREKALKQIQNIKRMLRELYERREKKIVNMALAASRTSPSFIDSTNLLPVEKKMFDSLLSAMDQFRKGVLQNVLNQRQPDFTEPRKADPLKSGDFVSASEIPSSGKLLKFTEFVPRFIGKELETYGPFEPGQEAAIPSEIADILIGKGSATELN